MDKNKVAAELLVLAKQIMAKDEEGEEVVDPKFLEKIKTLRTSLNKISQKKRRKLNQFGVAKILPTETVESLVDALLKVVTAG